MRISNQHLEVALCWAIVAFSVATVVLAVQKAQTSADLKDAKHRLDYMEAQLEGGAKPRSRRAQRRQDEDIDYRLPKSVLPIEYDLYLHPNIETSLFSGQERIKLSIVEATKIITLHAYKLDIQSVYVTGTGGWEEGTLEVDNFKLDEEREFLIIEMTHELPKDMQLWLGIIFKGEMYGKISGLYSSSYLTENKEQRVIATSKFEPTYARQAFPCFDEPAMKAAFTVTIVQPNTEGYHTLSNMNEEKSVNQGANTEVTFVKSVPMSTYLVCLIVSDFAHNSQEVNTQGIGSNFDIRIFATAHQLHKVDFALSTAVTVTEFYIQYFQVEYPLPKLDMAAIPDFASNAMEHWGLVTYRETALLYDEKISSTYNKQRVAEVVAHELAHMWFGNLVTMMWWNDLWLNEGFARYMQYKGVNEVYAAWGMPDQFIVHTLHTVMDYDATVASHPIVQTVENPDQITEIFDTITYDKGASVIRMLEDVVGADKFAEAVSNYLTKFAYQNAVTDDFLTEVANTAPGFDVKLMMRTWTEQMGLPVIEVKRSSASVYTLTQKRFLANIEDYELEHTDSPFNYKWSIPLTYRTDANTVVQRNWFNHDTPEVPINAPAGTKWLKLNAHQVGFYRVNYEENIWTDIIAELIKEPQTFDAADRANLLNDAFALADASQLEYSVALNMTQYLEKEQSFVPWYVAATNLRALQDNVMPTDIYLDYLHYARKLITKVYEQVSWNVKEDHQQNRLRVSVLEAACSFGLSDCLTQAATKFNAYLADPVANKPAPDLRQLVYYFGMQQVGTAQSWEQMWYIFVEEQDASEKVKLMSGLAGVRVPWLLHRFIELAGDEQYVRRQDYFTCIQNIAGNSVGEPVVWDYMRENWSDMVKRFGLNDRSFGRMIISVTSKFASETKLEEMTEFFGKYPEAGAGTAARKQALEKVKYRIKWLKQNKDQVAEWLQKQL